MKKQEITELDYKAFVDYQNYLINQIRLYIDALDNLTNKKIRGSIDMVIKASEYSSTEGAEKIENMIDALEEYRKRCEAEDK